MGDIGDANSYEEKIDNLIDSNNMISMNKAKLYIDTENNCGCINYGNKKYIVDINDFNKIIACKKQFIFYKDQDVYPAFCINNRKKTIAEFLYGFNPETSIYVFKNNNVLPFCISDVGFI